MRSIFRATISYKNHGIHFRGWPDTSQLSETVTKSSGCRIFGDIYYYINGPDSPYTGYPAYPYSKNDAKSIKAGMSLLSISTIRQTQGPYKNTKILRLTIGIQQPPYILWHNTIKATWYNNVASSFPLENKLNTYFWKSNMNEWTDFDRAKCCNHLSP